MANTRLGRILRLRCPRCGKSNVFHPTRFPFVSEPKMKQECEHCGYKFDREPGYFLGAMYVSYGLAVLEGIIAYFLAKYLIFGLSPLTLALITAAAILFCAMWNYRMARVIWLNVFP
jgi:uncharacterized protein (DUF983 family)